MSPPCHRGTQRGYPCNVGANSAGTQAKAVFKQRYQSKTLADTVRKTLVLQRTGGEWRIVSETQSKLP